MAKTLLLVDDETIIVEIAKKKFVSFGYNVFTAGNGEEALEVVLHQKIDLIVLDVQMPKMNGYTFLTELEKKQITDIPIIVLTAFGNMEPIFKRHKIKAYMTKPLQMEKLVEKVKEVVPNN